MTDEIKVKKSIWKKWWFWLVIVFVIIIIASVGGENKETKSEVRQPVTQEQTQPQGTFQEKQKELAEKPSVAGGQIEQQPEQEPTQKPTQQIVQEPEQINLSGIGQQASKKFTLESGLSIFRMTHSGQSNFSIWLLDGNGNKVELLVNEVGTFDGAKAVGINKKGTYILDISADGQWTVKIEQPRPTTAPSIPKTFSGVGQQVSGFVMIPKGLTTFRMTHNGQSNFSIWLLDKNGNKVELLVNEIGVFNGSKAVGIPSTGIYLLDISADGNWSITIE